MNPRQKEKQDLLDRIHDLVEEANRLPRSRASWDRRELIEWQLLLLFRRVANLSAGPSLQVGADSYVHGNEESDTSNQSMVYYNRNGKARRLRTGR